MANTTGKKFGGRKKGTPNKVTRDIREKFRQLIENNLEQLEKDLKVLEPKDRVRTVIELSKFVLPTLKAMDFEVSGEVNMKPITGMVIK